MCVQDTRDILTRVAPGRRTASHRGPGNLRRANLLFDLLVKSSMPRAADSRLHQLVSSMSWSLASEGLTNTVP